MGRFGAHIGGGLAGVPAKASEIGSECVQIFASSPQMWRPPNHKDEVVDGFRQSVSDFGFGPTVLHGIYLLNPASPDEALVEKSINSIAAHLGWAAKLGALGLVIHLGSSMKQPVEEAIGRVATNLKIALDRADSPAYLLLETCAGQGNTIGRKFEEIGYLVENIGDERVGVCLDTCHVYAAGYDLTTEEGLTDLVGQFDRHVGLAKLKAIHANDSKGALGSNLDRHENIGQGQIGEAGFARILQHPAFRDLPLYLEVPGYEGEGPDRENLDTLRRLAGA